MDDLARAHKAFSVDCFNNCWNYLDKAARSPADVEKMILLAGASLWHWQQRADCTPKNLAIGYWQVSRAYAMAQDARMAEFFAESGLAVSRENELGAFFVGYALEAKARALLLSGDRDGGLAAVAESRGVMAKIADEGDRAMLAADLDELASSTEFTEHN